MPKRVPLVVDLSALWAGPLCGHLLTQAGARVVKVESTRRPDGARFGPRAFYDLMHAGQEAVAFDFSTAEGRALLARLIAAADIVVEGSRPRALEQLGINVDDALKANPALVWVSLTAYGRHGSSGDRVGFGDDTAAAGGLVARDRLGVPVFVGDAIADPIAGLVAAAGAFAAWAVGGGVLVDVALSGAAAFIADAEPIADADDAEIVGAEGSWRIRSGGAEWPLQRPATRPAATGSASVLGADNAAVLSALT
jgi:crotonobetainyl-CoA:carnitine CoA-transferase CaiB-like acyl-CoA transferase